MTNKSEDTIDHALKTVLSLIESITNSPSEGIAVLSMAVVAMADEYINEEDKLPTMDRICKNQIELLKAVTEPESTQETAPESPIVLQ